MAERRMFSSKVVCSDAFCDMPFSAQALYYQLNMEADDDGFLNRAKRIQGSLGAAESDLSLLLEKRFVLGFKNGVVAIKHWRMNNQIRKDRYTPTQYQDEFNSLVIRPDGAYTEKEKETAVDVLATKWQPNGNHLATQVRLGKDRLGKYSIEGEGELGIGDANPRPQEKEKPSCQQIVNLYHSICKSFPSVRSISASRQKAIKARLNTYSLDDFKAVFENAEASSFLKGANDRNWTATFDWLIKDQNMAKVLEGNYADNGRKEIIPDWMQASRLGTLEKEAIKRIMGDNKPSELALASVRRMMDDPSNGDPDDTDDPEFAESVEKMQELLKEKYGKERSN